MKIIEKYKKIILLAIIVIASVLRLWKLGSIPPHLTPDEAALGYNAYSILKTGKDEFGNTLPLIFKSFGDYKPGLYIYSAVPTIAIFGLSEFATRLPSAIFGVLSVYFIYLLVKELFKKEKDLPIIVAAVAAVNPWLIYLSRGAWEVNLCFMLTILGSFLFLKSFEKPKYLYFSVISFCLTLFAYQGAKLSSGIVVALLLTVYFKSFKKIPLKKIIPPVALGLVLCIPIVLSFFSGRASRLNVFSVFSYPRPEKYLQDFLDQGNENVGDLTYYLFHSETLNFARGVMGRFYNHFSDRFLFFEGDWPNPRHTAPHHGMFLLSDLALLLIGLWIICKKKIKKGHLFIFLWVVFSVLPSIMSRDQVHAVRSMNLVLPLIVIMSLGLNWILRSGKKVIFVFSVAFLLSFSYFLDSYFVHLPKHDSKLWEYGYKQIVETITPIQGDYQEIVVQQSFAQPYIYFLFYQKYDPQKYQANNSWIQSENKYDVGYVTELDNIAFGPIDWSVNRGDKGKLFAADPIRIPPEDSSDEENFKVIKEIYYLNGLDLAFRIVEVKK